MKGKYFVAAGIAIIGFAIYYFIRRKNAQAETEPDKENERRHLTNAFSKAKEVAIGE